MGKADWNRPSVIANFCSITLIKPALIVTPIAIPFSIPYIEGNIASVTPDHRVRRMLSTPASDTQSASLCLLRSAATRSQLAGADVKLGLFDRHPASDQKLEIAAKAAWPYALLCSWSYLNDLAAAHDLMDPLRVKPWMQRR